MAESYSCFISKEEAVRNRSEQEETEVRADETFRTVPIEKKTTSKMKIMTGILVAIIIALVVGFIPLKEVTYTATDIAIEPLSYQVTALVKEEQLVQPFISSDIAFSRDEEQIAEALKQAYQQILVAYVSVHNTDTVSGAFYVHIVFYAPTGDQYAKGITLQLRPGELKEAKYGVSSIDANIDDLTWDYKITPEEKTTTKTATNYKKVSIFEYLLSRF
ncbi:hypothetical protein ACFLYR_09935 [Chloroflexota bacterium]